MSEELFGNEVSPWMERIIWRAYVDKIRQTFGEIESITIVESGEYPKLDQAYRRALEGYEHYASPPRLVIVDGSRNDAAHDNLANAIWIARDYLALPRKQLAALLAHELKHGNTDNECLADKKAAQTVGAKAATRMIDTLTRIDAGKICGDFSEAPEEHALPEHIANMCWQGSVKGVYDAIVAGEYDIWDADLYGNFPERIHRIKTGLCPGDEGYEPHSGLADPPPPKNKSKGPSK